MHSQKNDKIGRKLTYLWKQSTGWMKPTFCLMKSVVVGKLPRGSKLESSCEAHVIDQSRAKSASDVSHSCADSDDGTLMKTPKYNDSRQFTHKPIQSVVMSLFGWRVDGGAVESLFTS